MKKLTLFLIAIGSATAFASGECEIKSHYKSGDFPKTTKQVVTTSSVLECIDAAEAQLGQTLEDSPWFTAEVLLFTVKSASFTFIDASKKISGKVESR